MKKTTKKSIIYSKDKHTKKKLYGGVRAKGARKFFSDEAGKAEIDARNARQKLNEAAREKESESRKERSVQDKERLQKFKDLKRKDKEFDKKIRDAKTPEEREKLEEKKKKEMEKKRKDLDDDDLLRIKRYDCTSKSHYMEGMKESRRVKRKIKKYFKHARPASTATSLPDLVKELVKINMRFEKCRGRDINDDKPFYVGQDSRVKVPRAKRMAYKSLATACTEFKKARKELGMGISEAGLSVNDGMKKNLQSTCDYVHPICGGLGQATKCLFGALMSKGHDTFCKGCIPITDVADEGESRDKAKDELYAEMTKASEEATSFKDKKDKMDETGQIPGQMQGQMQEETQGQGAEIDVNENGGKNGGKLECKKKQQKAIEKLKKSIEEHEAKLEKLERKKEQAEELEEIAKQIIENQKLQGGKGMIARVIEHLSNNRDKQEELKGKIEKAYTKKKEKIEGEIEKKKARITEIEAKCKQSKDNMDKKKLIVLKKMKK